jgi:hypothetical protein
VDDLSLMVYRWILYRGADDLGKMRNELRLNQECFTQCLDRLRLLGLLRADATGKLIAARPDAAAADLVDPLERQILQFREEAGQIRENFRTLTTMYHKHRARRGSDSVTVVPEGIGLNLVICEIMESGVTTVSIVHPGPTRFGALLDQVVAQTPALREHGVSLRVVCVPSALESAKKAQRVGAEVRTAQEVAGGAIILDRHVAFIPAMAGGTDDAVVVVRQATVLDVLRGAFEQHWSAGVRVIGSGSRADGGGDEVKQWVLRLLAQGARDEMIARRVGLSVRTCRKYVAEILHETSAKSRFQAGYLVGIRSTMDLI